MEETSITELRRNLPAYIDKVRRGARIEVTVRGRVVARIVPVADEREAARQRLAALEGKAVLGDLVTPIGQHWDAER